MGIKANKRNHHLPYATEDELDWLEESAKTIKDDECIIILGAGPGVMAIACKEGNIDCRMTIIDHNTCDYTLAHLEEAGKSFLNNVDTIRGDSANVGYYWNGRSVGMLVIDADHEENGVALDIAAWLPHVVNGGLIFFHDYDASGTPFESQEQYPGVKIAVDREMSEFQFITRVGTAVVYRKFPANKKSQPKRGKSSSKEN